MWRWPYLLFVVLFIGGSAFAVSALHPLYEQTSPSSDPPWYFIRRDALEGLYFLAGWALVLGGIFLRKKAGDWIWLLACFTLWPVFRLFLILAKTRHLFDPLRAESAWRSFGEYMDDRQIFFGVFFIGLISMLFALRRYMPEEKEPVEGEKTSPGVEKNNA